jgi:ribonucleoside-diphosphate reductase alpha chain
MTAAQPAETQKNALHDLGYKIFLDRYAQKDMTRATLAEGDTVIVVVDPRTGQREVGKITRLELPQVTVELKTGDVIETVAERVDKPLETDPAHMLDRVAAGIAEIEATPELRAEWTARFRWMLEDWKFVPAGRILAAAGTGQDLTLYNCYVVPSPRDSRQGIITTLGQMTEIMSRGGGVGINVSSLRPRHAYVKGVNGRSSGSVSWGALYSFVTGLIEQGGSRRGALMLILNDWHPDVFEFINSKRVAGRITNANISVGVSDKLMEAVQADADWDLVFPDNSDPDYEALWDGNLEQWLALGKKVIRHQTVKARDLWNAIIESAWASAEPGVWFRERANKMSNSWYFNPLICTNPCVTGDTLIYTGNGLMRARELFDSEQPVEVVLDNRFGTPSRTSRASHVFRTGRKPVYRLQTREGYHLRATAGHRVMTPSGWKELRELAPGSRIHILNRKGGFGTEGTLELGRVLGWAVGDGTVKRDRVVLSFFGEEKRSLAPLFAESVNTLVAPLTAKRRTCPVGVTEVVSRDEARVGSVRLHTIADDYGLTGQKHRVPERVFKGNEALQRGFLQALFTADGSFQDGGAKGGSIRLAASSLELLEGVQILLLNFGIASRIYRQRRAAGYRQMPDVRREPRSYWCRAQHELVISKRNLLTFADEISFLVDHKQNRLVDYVTRGRRGTYRETFTAVVESITPDGTEDVFDLTEPLTHSFVANGIVTHNCGEQSLPGWAVCNLGAINLAKFYDPARDDVDWDKLGEVARYAVRFLDNVIDSTPYFFEENREQQLSERRVGLNTMGIAELMIRLRIRYGSDESIAFIDRLYQVLATEVYQTSIDLAREKGAFPQFDVEQFLQSGFMQAMPESIREGVRRHGIRNVTLMTQAPNGTIGTMVNTSTGIEPFFSWVYYRKSRLGLHEEQVPLVQEWYAANPEATGLPDYFVTAMELTPQEHVRVQAAIQRWVDSSISKTCNVPREYTVEQVRELYEYMYALGCKGGTIYRDGSRDEQVLMLKEKDATTEAQPKVESAQEVMALPRIYPRPEMLSGVTMSRKTPFGTAYITMNSDEDDNPFEVFVTVGKAGSDLQADAEGLGRMISLQLRTTPPDHRVEMMRLIIDQLRGIGGTRSAGFGPGRVTSLPDAVAAVLEEFYFTRKGVPYAAPNGRPKTNGATGQAEAPPFAETHERNSGKPRVAIPGADICPSCGTVSLVRAEGCRKCLTCEYTEC